MAGFQVVLGERWRSKGGFAEKKPFSPTGSALRLQKVILLNQGKQFLDR